MLIRIEASELSNSKKAKNHIEILSSIPIKKNKKKYVAMLDDVKVIKKMVELLLQRSYDSLHEKAKIQHKHNLQELNERFNFLNNNLNENQCGIPEELLLAKNKILPQKRKAEVLKKTQEARDEVQIQPKFQVQLEDLLKLQEFQQQSPEHQLFQQLIQEQELQGQQLFQQLFQERQLQQAQELKQAQELTQAEEQFQVIPKNFKPNFTAFFKPIDNHQTLNPVLEAPSKKIPALLKEQIEEVSRKQTCQSHTLNPFKLFQSLISNFPDSPQGDFLDEVDSDVEQIDAEIRDFVSEYA